MTTRNWVLIGLGVTAAAGIAALFTTERGKKVRNTVADTLGDWTNQLTHLAKNNGDGLAATAKAAKSNAQRHLKHLP